MPGTSPEIVKDVRDYLVNTTGLTNVRVNESRPEPKDEYSIHEFEGPPNIKIHGTGLQAFDRASLQIQARATSHKTARTMIYNVINALDGLQDVTINGTLYQYFEEMKRPRVLEQDEDDTTMYAWEVRVVARRT